MKVLVTAGSTRNPIDAVRYVSASSTGTTGVFLARALRDQGAGVHLLGSPETLLRGPELDGEAYGSTRDLMVRMEAWIRQNPTGAVIHASAVGDYELTTPIDDKIPSGRSELVLSFHPAPKIADHVRTWGHSGLYVTFKAAPPSTTEERLVEIAVAQRRRTGCDFVFANVIGRLDTEVAWVGEEVVVYPTRDEALARLVQVVTSLIRAEFGAEKA